MSPYPRTTTYGIGDELEFTVTFSAAVTITGAVSLPITLDTGGVVNATLVDNNGSPSTTHTFRYTVVEGNEDTDGIEVGTALVLPAGASIQNDDGFTANRTLTNIGDTTGILVDGIPPDTGIAPPPTPIPTPTPTPTPTPIATPTPTPTPEPEPEPEPDPTPTPEVSCEPGPGQLIFGRTGDSLFLFGPEVFGTQGDDTIIGGEGAKIITAVGGRNLIFGNTGDDLIRGGDCDDTIFGGQDNDTIYGGGGNDILVGDDGDDVLFGERGDNLMFGNQGNDILQAGEGNDTLFGGQGNDILIGGPGDNLLSGDLGDDTLTGGGGNNIFVLRDDGGENLITDFQVGADRIGLSHGLTFEVLEFTQLDEQLLLAVGGKTLAVLPEVSQEQLNSPANFITLNW